MVAREAGGACERPTLLRTPRPETPEPPIRRSMRTTRRCCRAQVLRLVTSHGPLHERLQRWHSDQAARPPSASAARRRSPVSRTAHRPLAAPVALAMWVPRRSSTMAMPPCQQPVGGGKQNCQMACPSRSHCAHAWLAAGASRSASPSFLVVALGKCCAQGGPRTRLSQARRARATDADGPGHTSHDSCAARYDRLGSHRCPSARKGLLK